MQTLPVIFRMESTGPGKKRPFAIFPTLQGTGRFDATCYDQVGQHGTVCKGYYSSCRLAKPEEYESLFAELRSIYETGEDAVKLVIVQRWTRHHDKEAGR